MVFGILTGLHLLLGINGLKRFAWLITRHNHHNSNLDQIRNENINYYQVIENIKLTTPLDTKITLYGGSKAAEEIAFYTYPRRIYFHPVDSELCDNDRTLLLQRISQNQLQVVDQCAMEEL